MSLAGFEGGVGDVAEFLDLDDLPRLYRTLLDAWVVCMPEPDPKRKPDDEDKPAERLTWMRGWAQAVSRDGLGLTEEAWLDMIPRQVDELKKIRLHQMQREEYLTGIIAATVENFSACHPKKAVSAEAFMLHKFDHEDEEPVAIGDQIMAAMAKLPESGYIDATNIHGQHG